MLDERHVENAADISARFGLGDDAMLAGPVARGEMGQVWRLTTTAGRWAVKESFDPPPPQVIAADGAYQDAVLAGGVPMPAVVRTSSGDVHAHVGPSGASSMVRVYEWVDLLPRERVLEPEAVGQVVAAIHRVRHHGSSPLDPWFTDAVGAETWDELVRAATDARAPFAEQLAARRDELVALERLLQAPRNLQTCHRDLFADNVLRTVTGSICVVDWEESGLADPTQELGLVLFEFSCGEPARARSLYDAYLEAAGIGRVQRPGDFSMVIAQLGHIGELSCRRWLDPARAHERERNAGRVEEFVEQGITRSMIDVLLAAIAPD